MASNLESMRGPEWDGYVKGIIDNPDSLVPRINFAEWLEAKGFSDRGQFIRHQCDANKLTAELHGNTELLPGDRIRLAATQRLEKALWKKNKKEWEATENPPSQVLQHVEWERGFPYFGTVDWTKVDPQALREVMSRYPIQGLVVLNCSADSMRTFLEEPWVPQLRHLILEENTSLGDEGARAIAGCDSLGKLQYLNLAQCGIGLEGARALALARNLKQLRVLRMRGNDITLGGAEALAQASTANLPKLWKLTFRKKIDGHDAGEFFVQINEEKMATYGFTRKLEGGQTWQKETLPTQKELDAPVATPATVQKATRSRVGAVLSGQTGAMAV